MRIDKKLNLSVPVTLADGSQAYIHSMPISRDVFEQYFVVIAKAFAQIYGGGLNVVAGPRIAALMLKKVATEMGEWDIPGGVKDGLMAEVRRLSNVVMPTPQGWQVIPLQVALDQKLIDDDELAEVDGRIIFFILASAMHDRDEGKIIIQTASSLWKCRAESSSAMELAASLQTSMQAVATGETVKASSIPS